jgi:hypothetical protein
MEQPAHLPITRGHDHQSGHEDANIKMKINEPASTRSAIRRELQAIRVMYMHEGDDVQYHQRGIQQKTDS